jgi:hypothetical protein
MYPLVVASLHLDDLLSTMARLTTPFAELAQGQESIDPQKDGEPVLIGQVGSLSYMLEYGGTTFAMAWGLLERMATETNSLVISAIHDPMEDQAEFFVARGRDILRAYWFNSKRTTRPFSLGTPLPTEESAPLSDPHGRGFTAALKHFGFALMDHGKGFERSPGDRWVGWKGSALSILQGDGLREQVNAHVREFANPAYSPPVPKVRVRRK